MRKNYRFLFLLAILLSIFIDFSDSQFPPSDVIELPVGRFPEPDCRYSVQHPNGEIITQKVNIGDEIVHSWKCAYGTTVGGTVPKNHLFCIVVGNCTIEGGDRHVEIVDQNGCSVFPTILPNVDYSDDLSAQIRVHAFALDVDTTAVHFTCNIRMLFKEHDQCQRPKCVTK